ncbi:unnamed protein product [Sphagnum troendelagicum]|uniref:AP2/ERF domain-containing protein n=1 Tax=Sphagnum troendelagicum TaxID=128251 RepID=A0ABP0TX14_9BRYO
MPEQFESPCRNRRKQLRQFDQCSSTFSCPRCASNIRTCQFYSDTNSCGGAVLHQIDQGTLSEDINDSSRTRKVSQTTVAGDNIASKSEIIVELDCGKIGEEDAAAVSNTTSTGRCSETNGRVRVGTASAAEPKDVNEIPSNTSNEFHEGCTQAFRKVPSQRSSLSMSRRRSRRESRMQHRMMMTTKLKTFYSCSRSYWSHLNVPVKIERDPSMEKAAPCSRVAALRSGNEITRSTTAYRRTSSRIIELERDHGSQTSSYNGVRTRRGVKGFLVEIRPPKWKKTIWLGTYNTAIEAAAAHDAGAFYTDKPKKKFNFRNHGAMFSFPPLPPYISDHLSNNFDSSSSPQVMEDFKAFVKKQATLAASKTVQLRAAVKDHAVLSPSVLALPADSELAEPMNVTRDTAPEECSSAVEIGPNCELSEFREVSPALPALTSTVLEMELELNSIGVQMHPQYPLPLDEYLIWNFQDSWPPGMFQEFPTFTTTSLLQQEICNRVTTEI